jgi:hypothetical protein
MTWHICRVLSLAGGCASCKCTRAFSAIAGEALLKPHTVLRSRAAVLMVCVDGLCFMIWQNRRIVYCAGAVRAGGPQPREERHPPGGIQRHRVADAHLRNLDLALAHLQPSRCATPAVKPATAESGALTRMCCACAQALLAWRPSHERWRRSRRSRR